MLVYSTQRNVPGGNLNPTTMCLKYIFCRNEMHLKHYGPRVIIYHLGVFLGCYSRKIEIWEIIPLYPPLQLTTLNEILCLPLY